MRTSIIGDFCSTVEERKECVAIQHNDKSITFERLGCGSNTIAMSISELVNSCRNRPIAVFLPKSINSVLADIGIILSGNAFMNLDILTPVERINSIVNNVDPILVITDDNHINLFNKSAVLVRTIESLLEKKYECCKCENWRSVIDTDPFCIINTSGSTGTPKSVILNHRSFFDFIDWSVEEFGFNEMDVIGSLSPIVFDIFVFELCLLITKGCKISIIDGSLASFPIKLVEKLYTSEITFIFWVPTIMVNIANMKLLAGHVPSKLRLIWFAGEVFPTKQFLYWYDMLPNVMFVNMYGPIEITLDCTFHVVTSRPREDEALPIGIPCNNTDIILLDNDNKEAEVGKEAELCVRGTSLAMGYYNNPDKTAAAFVQNPLNNMYPEIIYRTGDIVIKDTNGILHIIGRKDSMIKHNGYRIELAEIEHVIVNRTKLVSNSCAVYDKENKKIVLFYESDSEVERSEFRKMLAGVLPKYMIPDMYVKLQELPRNTNGKIDRAQLMQNASSVFAM